MFPGKWDDISSPFGLKHEFGRPTRDHCRGKTGDWGLAATTDRWWRVLWDCQAWASTSREKEGHINELGTGQSGVGPRVQRGTQAVLDEFTLNIHIPNGFSNSCMVLTPYLSGDCLSIGWVLIQASSFLSPSS